MLKMNHSELEEILETNRHYVQNGKLADYIPELAHANPNTLGFTVASTNGEIISVGNCEEAFTIQSISKIISLIMALQDHGSEKVFSKVGMESSGEPFNSVSELETKENHKPLNPLINAGAIAVASMIKGQNVSDKFSRVCEFLYNITGNNKISLNKRVYESEKRTGDRNRSLAYFMKSTNVIETDVEEALDLYFRLCSINVTCSDLAKIGVFLANGGEIQGRQIDNVTPELVQIVFSIMLTAGMYNQSGECMMKIGIPAKSGVSGGILAVVPNYMGIGIIGPAINDKGNSIAGLKILENFSKKYKLHLFMKQ
jgi:glutaminase